MPKTDTSTGRPRIAARRYSAEGTGADWETLEMVQRYAHLSADHLARSDQPHTQVVDLQTAAG